MKGLTTPLSRWVQVVNCLCRYLVTCCSLYPTGLIPWFSKLREILTLLCCITLSSSREKPTQAQEVAGRIFGAIAGEVYAKSSQDLISRQLANFWRRCQGDLCQVKTYQVPIINSHLLHYIIRYSPLIFLSPTSKMFLEKHKKICLSFALLPFVFLFSFWLLMC